MNLASRLTAARRGAPEPATKPDGRIPVDAGALPPISASVPAEPGPVDAHPGNSPHGGEEPGVVPAPESDLPAFADAPAAPARRGTVDALSGLKARSAEALFERLGSRITDPSLTEEQLRKLARDELSQVIDAEQVPLSPRNDGG